MNYLRDVSHSSFDPEQRLVGRVALLVVIPASRLPPSFICFLHILFIVFNTVIRIFGEKFWTPWQSLPFEREEKQALNSIVTARLQYVPQLPLHNLLHDRELGRLRQLPTAFSLQTDLK